MFDDDDDRLLIDDHEQSVDCGPEKEKVSSNDGRISFTPPDPEFHSNFPASNGISILSGLNSSKEEGELDDEEMESSFSRTPAKNLEFKTSTPIDRKRSNGEHTPKHSTAVSPKKAKLSSKHEKRDQGTSVVTKAVQADTDESPFDLESGSSFVMQLTVVCKPSEGTLLVTGKWKDLELTGTISDGEPPGFHNFIKKRNALMNNNSSGESEKSNMGTPSKKRLGRGNESKKKAATKADDDEDDLDVTGTEPRDGNSSGGSLKLMEVPPRTSMHTCPYDGCEHRYELATEIEYHIGTVHKKKAVMYEHNSCQTTPEVLEKKVMVSVCTDTEGLCPEVKVAKTEDPVALPKDVPPAVAKVEGVVKSPSSHFSDISDDAPQLQKEEPHPVELSNGVASRPSTSTPASAAGQPAPATPTNSTPVPQAAIVQPSAVVPPVAASPRAPQANGLLMPANYPFMAPFTPVAGTSSVTTPTREHNKLNQLKDASSSVVGEAVANAHTPAKPIPSPAQNRTAFAVPPMAHPHPAAAAQNPMQAQQQMMQQLQMQQMMFQQLGMRSPFQIPASAQEQMNQLAAIQAMQGPYMFPKH